jgi:hypothetical protein
MGEIGKSPHVQSRKQALAIAYAKERGHAEGGLVDPGHARGGLVAGLVNHDFDPDLPRVSEDVRIEPVAQLPAEYSRVIQQLKEGARQPPAVPVNRQRGGGVTAPPAFKRSKAQVNYRRGYPLRQCGVCMMYWHRNTHQMYGGCTDVEGNITPYGLCNLFSQLTNPYGNTMHKDHRREMERFYNESRGEHHRQDLHGEPSR